MTYKSNKKFKIGIIGLGYVGLPLAIEFGKIFDVVGYDTNLSRIKNLNKNIDSNDLINKKEFNKSKFLNYSYDPLALKECNFYIVTVPTPITKKNKPDLKPLTKACLLLSNLIQKKDIIVFESTVYPGLTEEYCAPLLEKNSNLKHTKDFFCGYSPERINPGDNKHTLRNIVKIISGCDKKTIKKIHSVYKSIIDAGIFIASSIKVAESAKVIENTQRDLNIALINELSILFNKMNINTLDVLKAASTKWNFQNFSPGLVGGHCIGVDPYYLTYKAKQVGYNPKIILSGRKLNDSMHQYIYKNLSLAMQKKKIKIKKSKVLILGYAFKENCKDIRNTKILDLYNLISKSAKAYVYDPVIDIKDVNKSSKVNFLKDLNHKNFDAVIIALKHNQFKKYKISYIKKLCKKNHIIYDLKGLFKKDLVDITL